MNTNRIRERSEPWAPEGRYWAQVAYLVVAWLFVLGLLGQVYLAGLALLAGQQTFEAHIGLGHMLGILLLPLLILAYVARFPRSTKSWTWALFGVYIVQAEVFAVIRNDLPWIAALHPVLALVLFWAAVTVAQRALAGVRRQQLSGAGVVRSAESTNG